MARRLRSLDVLFFFHNYEPSRAKLFEFARTFEPIEFAAFLYMLENTRIEPKRELVGIRNELLPTLPQRNVCIQLSHAPVLRTERVRKRVCQQCKLFTPGRWREEEIENGSTMIEMLYVMSESSNPCNLCVYDRLLIHNIGTAFYKKLLAQIRHLLFQDNLQTNRNRAAALNVYVNTTSIVHEYMQYTYTLRCMEPPPSDPDNFRTVILPRCNRLESVSQLSHKRYAIQPLYQGIFLVAHFDTNGACRCYNRHGELIQGLGCTIKLTTPPEQSLTLAVVLLPTDPYSRSRSWRYWDDRISYVLYVVDLLRIGRDCLTHLNFRKRIRRLRQARFDEKSNRVFVAPNDWCWETGLHNYMNSGDLFTPIVGAVFRKWDEPGVTTPPYEFRFPVSFCYDILTDTVIDVLKRKSNYKLPKCDRLFITAEMADTMTVHTAYAHDDNYFYLCHYNRDAHQFEHWALLQRVPEEPPTLIVRYRTSESIVVLNIPDNISSTVIKPRGLLYLRVYYELSGTVLTYEYKPTTSKYDVPITQGCRNKNTEY